MNDLGPNWHPNFGTIYTWYAMDRNGKRLKASELRKCITSMVAKKIAIGAILERFFIESFLYSF